MSENNRLKNLINPLLFLAFSQYTENLLTHAEKRLLIFLLDRLTWPSVPPLQNSELAGLAAVCAVLISLIACLDIVPWHFDFPRQFNMLNGYSSSAFANIHNKIKPVFIGMPMIFILGNQRVPGSIRYAIGLIFA